MRKKTISLKVVDMHWFSCYLGGWQLSWRSWARLLLAAARGQGVCIVASAQGKLYACHAYACTHVCTHPLVFGYATHSLTFKFTMRTHAGGGYWEGEGQTAFHEMQL